MLRHRRTGKVTRPVFLRRKRCALGCGEELETQGLREDVSECLLAGDSKSNKAVGDVEQNWKIQVLTPKRAAGDRRGRKMDQKEGLLTHIANLWTGLKRTSDGREVGVVPTTAASSAGREQRERQPSSEQEH